MVTFPRPAFLVAAAALAPVALGAEGIAASDISFLAYLAGGVVGVVAVVAWVDHRVDRRVKAHEVVEDERAEARHQSLLTEIRHLTDRLVDAGALPASSPSGAWPLHDHRRHGDKT
jgi:hypothetical protein